MKEPIPNFSRMVSNRNTGRLHALLLFLFLLSGIAAMGQTPVIQSVTPLKASYGETVTIKGSDFVSKEYLLVKFGSVPAEITESNAGTIKAMVPAGATYGPVSVTNVSAGLTAYAAQPFLLSFGGYKEANVPFDPTLTYPGTGVTDICACDLDGDGKNDLVSSSPATTSTTVYLNSSTIGNISFTNRQEILVGSRTSSVICGDLDGDGKADLIFTGNATDGTKAILLRNTSSRGNISFASAQNLTVPQKVLAKAAVQDLNGDGKPEIVLTNMSDEQVVVFKNTSVSGTISFDLNFHAFSVSVASLQGLRIKDVNNDGLVDITVSTLYGNNVFFLINNSTGGNISFETPLNFGGTGLSNHEFEDLDGDGKNELITLDYFSETANIYQNNSSGTTISFDAKQSFATGEGPVGLQIGDFNGDKKPDILIGHNLEASAYVLLNTSTEGSLSFKTHILSGSGKFTNLQTADLDGDAIPDIAVADREGNLFNLFLNRSCISPAINPSGTVELCNGSSVTLAGIRSPAAETSPPLLNYQWLRNNTVVGTEYSLTVTEPGTYSLQISSANGCDATSGNVTVRSFASPEDLSFHTPAPSCEGQSIELSVTPAMDDATYTWLNLTTGFTETTNTHKLQIGAANPAEHDGTYQVNISRGPCEMQLESDPVTIYANPQATITADGPLTICPGESRVLSIAESFAGYHWKKDGTFIQNATTSSFTATESGAYTVMVLNQDGCETETTAVQLEVDRSLQASFDGPTAACLNQPVQFTNRSSIGAGKTATYLWDFGDGNQSTELHPTHTYTQTGSQPYKVTLTVQYQNSNCSSTFSSTIQVISTSGISIAAEGSTSFCAGDSVKVFIRGKASAVQWSNGDSGAFTWIKEGGAIEAEVLTTAGCTLTKSLTLHRLPAPELVLTADQLLIKRGESVRLQAKGAVSYTWEPAESLDNPTLASPLASPKKTTTYKVTAIGEEGCVAEAEITITVDESFIVHTPKLLVPATDQSWKVGNIENYPDVSLQIMNKFGNPVFRAAPYENNWSGTDQANQQTEGVYYYIFKNAAGQVIKSGSITVIR